MLEIKFHKKLTWFIQSINIKVKWNFKELFTDYAK